MYDPKFSVKQMYDNYGKSRSTPTSRSASAGKQAADTMRSVGVRGIGARPVTFPDRDDDRGSTYDVVPQVFRQTTPPPPEEKSNIEKIKEKAVGLFNFFGRDEPEEEEPNYGNVYRGPMFTRTPIDISAQMARINKAVDYSQATPPLYRGNIPNDANMRYDVVPPPSANPNLQRNAINRIIKSLAPNSKEYKIKRGDTLSEIAQKEGMKVSELAKINKIKDINRIIEGETLLIPASQEVTKVMDLVDSVDPDAQFYQSGVPMEQRIFEPELGGYDEIALPSGATIDKKIKGLGARPEVTVTELDSTGVATDDDMGLPSTRSDTETIIALEPMFEFIQEGEGDYNSSNRGTIGKNIIGSTNNTTRDGKSLTEMTIGEIQTKQAIKDPNNTERLFAVGRFQTIPTTLAMAVDALNLSDDTVFNEDTQDKIGKYLITEKRKKVGKYLQGNNSVSQDEAMLELAKEFASFPVPYDMTIRRGGKDVKLKKGDSYYGSGNKAQHTFEEVEDELDKLRGNI